MGLNHGGLDAKTVTYLENSGLLTRETNGSMRIFSPIFSAYVKQQQDSAATGIVLHPQSGLVLRSGMPLDEELTPLEFRLLSFFMDHTGEICEKNDLITHIWPDDQLQEGIRDDRLAQLVRRLRSKVEMNGTSHTYIQTVRGRVSALNSQRRCKVRSLEFGIRSLSARRSAIGGCA